METSQSGKTTALIAYAPFVGFMIAYFINRDENNEFATWHIKNMFGLSMLFLSSLIVESQIDVSIGDILWLLCCALWIFCWIMAYLYKKQDTLFLSNKFQDWFTFLN